MSLNARTPGMARTRSIKREAGIAMMILAGIIIAPCHSIAADPQSDPVVQAVEKGLSVLERGAKEYPSHQSCFSCHHQTLPLLAMKTSRGAGLRFDEELFRNQVKLTRQSFAGRQERLAKGEHVGGRAATVSYGLWTLFIADEAPDDLSAAMATYLLSLQHEDGRWTPPSNRPPLEVSPVSCTVLTAIGLKRFASEDQREKASAAIDRAKAWLQTAPLVDQEDLNFAMWGEKLLDGNQARLLDLRERVLKEQQPDGGWRQLPELTSDAYSTGQTLVLLMETGLAATDPAVEKGIQFLLKSQQEGGSWHVVTRSKPIQPWFDNGDPHEKDQFISIAATGWATAALARTRLR
jgi:N-acyl-D-amino-acid deacylase